MNQYLLDVTQKYFENAKPGIGFLQHDEGVDEQDILTSKLLFDIFGGTIRTLKVEHVNGRDLKTPDAIWNGIYWEYKQISTNNSINDRIKNAWHQLEDYSERKGTAGKRVGIVVDIKNRKMNMESTRSTVERVFVRKIKYPADLIIKEGNRIICILRK